MKRLSSAPVVFMALLLAALCTSGAFAQQFRFPLRVVTNGCTTVVGSSASILESDCTGKALRPPSLTTTERDLMAAPQAGDLIYNETATRHESYTGAEWMTVGGEDCERTACALFDGTQVLGSASVSGRLGVGTAFASAPLHIVSDNNLEALQIDEPLSLGDFWRIYTNSGGALNVEDENGVLRFALLDGGGLGFGGSTGTYSLKFAIASPTFGDDLAIEAQTGSGLGGGGSLYLDGGDGGILGDVLLTTVRAGKVGIGEGAPAAKLGIRSTSTQLRLAYDGVSYWSDSTTSDGGRTLSGFGTDADFAVDFTGATDGDFSVGGSALFLDVSEGYLGVGTASPTSMLHVSGTASASEFVTLNGTNTSASTSIHVGLSNAVGFSPSGGSLSAVRGLSNAPVVSGSSLTISSFQAIFSRLSLGAGFSGTITEASAMVAGNAVVSGGAITTQYGLLVGDLTSGTNNRGVGVGVTAGGGNFNVYASGSAPNYFAGNVGIATSSPTEALDVDSDTVRLRQARTPASASATCSVGEIAWDASFVYVCVGTDTWKRSALSTW